MLTPPHVKCQLERERAARISVKTHGGGLSGEHAVMSASTQFDCSPSVSVGSVELWKNAPLCFPGLEVETLSTPHLSDSFITTEFLCLAAGPLTETCS